MAKPWQRVVLIFAAVLVWTGMLNLPLHAQGGDPSWEIGLGYFLRHRFQAGMDYVFTYGPLGYFLTESYDPALYWLKYAWEILIKLVFAGVIWKISYSAAKFHERLTVLLAAALVALLLPPIRDALYVGFLFAAGLCLPGALFAILCACLALTKFSLLLIGVFLCAIVGVHRRSLVAPILFVAVFVALWLGLGQSLKNIPIYLSRSWEMTAGYDAAMARTGPTSQVLLALAVMLLLGAVAVRASWPNLIALAAVTFLSFKHAFVRQDANHSAGFFVFATLAFISFPTARPWLQKIGIGLSLLALVAYRDQPTSVRLIFDHWMAQAGALARPANHREKLQREYVRLEQRFDLPQMRRQIGTDSVDVMGLRADQRIAILNQLQWRPRPVFEGYSAYTPGLLALNGKFYQQGHAPDFVIVAWGELDRRLPAANDGAALLELLARYEPVEREKQFHLFRRAGTPVQQTSTAPSSTTQIRIGEPVVVGPVQTAAIQIKYSLLGKLRSVFYKPALAFARLTLASGEVRTYRCVPSIVASRFLLTPLIESLDDLVGLYSESEEKIVTRVEINADKLWFQPSAQLTLGDFTRRQRQSAPASF